MPTSDGRLLRLAVPNKGSLAQDAADMLREAGYKQRTDAKRLTLTDGENGVEFFYLRPRDIALYVGEGTLDVGITGRDLLLDSGSKAEEAMSLGFGRSKFRFAAPPLVPGSSPSGRIPGIARTDQGPGRVEGAAACSTCLRGSCCGRCSSWPSGPRSPAARTCR